jgi:hypothetical protein
MVRPGWKDGLGHHRRHRDPPRPRDPDASPLAARLWSGQPRDERHVPGHVELSLHHAGRPRSPEPGGRLPHEGSDPARRRLVHRGRGPACRSMTPPPANVGPRAGRAAPRPWMTLRILAMPSPSAIRPPLVSSVDVNSAPSTSREKKRHVAGEHHSRDTGGGWRPGTGRARVTAGETTGPPEGCRGDGGIASGLLTVDDRPGDERNPKRAGAPSPPE